MIEITDVDIEKVEQKFGLTFDAESREFIKCLESKDIQACPGAGKTTSLVAKLDILSNYMPFDDNSAILVLTHTNVAVDEIKNKLGINASKVLGYPNHVGTFQSFVNKYLAIPMYVKLFGKKPERIDDDIFVDLFFNKLENNTKYGLKEKFKKGTTSEIEKINKVKNFLKSFYIDENEFLQNFDGTAFIYRHNPPSNTYIQLKTLKKEILQKGVLTFKDTYFLSIMYLNKYPQIIEIFQKRFKYVFVDEAQDTDDRQFEIINKLFSENTIVQKIGDNNQAIFNFSGAKDKGWEVDENSIKIKNTKRLSALISEQVIKVAIDRQELNGNDTIDIQPTIILFDNAEGVLPKFGDLIIENELHLDEKHSFKAIGAIGKESKNGDTILDYFPQYQQNNIIQANDTLVEKFRAMSIENIRPKNYKNILLDILTDYLKEKNILNNAKVFTKNTILFSLQENNEEEYNNFKLKLFYITEKLASLECVENDIKELLSIFLDFKEETLDDEVLSEVIKTYQIQLESKSKQNICTHESDDINFDIAISTIHKVKGETHTATLVLETFKSSYDLIHLIKLFQGRKFAGANKDKKRLIYVAMSRPTHFLCLAMHKEQIKDLVKDVKSLEDNGFRVITL
ncbi:MAG: ATP-dependent DNA helicase UvrD/PcrA [uncultured Sulfurovum sp.]|uniref:DNA 3'-5' helicase II n=1 Tax=uncultured Sulfurovum sp. TaxID=269237 RepID=A0A6S6SC43_9BACT|nr:MAG: ATP-dependent DNA helicase UvrD/PcrA [uncultured Sulfurovum sp.]